MNRDAPDPAEPGVAFRSRLLPPVRRRAVPWSGVDVLLLIIGFGFLVPIFLASLAGHRFGAVGHDSSTVLWVAICSGLLTVVGVPGLLKRSRGAELYQLGLHRSRFWSNMLLGFGAYLIAAPIVVAVMFALLRFLERTPHPIEQVLRQAPTVEHMVLAFVCAVVIAPLQEELLFRGVLLYWLRQVVGPWPAIVSSSLIFAALHSDAWPAPIPLFVLALFLGYLAHRTGSLVSPITLHAIFNAANLVLLFLVLKFEPGEAH